MTRKPISHPKQPTGLELVCMGRKRAKQQPKPLQGYDLLAYPLPNLAKGGLPKS